MNGLFEFGYDDRVGMWWAQYLGDGTQDWFESEAECSAWMKSWDEIEGETFKPPLPMMTVWAPDGKRTVRLAAPLHLGQLVDEDDEVYNDKIAL